MATPESRPSPGTEVLDLVPDPVIRLGTDGTLTFANRAAIRLLARAHESPVGKNLADFVHADDRSLVDGLFVGGGARVEVRFVVPHASWQSLTTSRLPSDEWLAVSHDVTRLKNLEQTAHARGEGVARSLEVGRVVAWEHDLATGISSRSGPVAAVYRVQVGAEGSLAELAAAVAPDDSTRLLDNVRRMATGEHDLDEIVTLARPDERGRDVRLHVQGRALHDDTGRPTRLVGVTKDVSGGAFEEALRRSDAKFRQLFRYAPHPMVLQRIADRRVVDINEALLRLAGVDREALVGTDGVVGPFVARSKAVLDMIWQRILEEQSFRGLPVTLEHETGSSVHLVVSSEVIELDGVPHALVSLEDVTRLVDAQEAVRESEARFQELVTHLDDVFWLLDPHSERMLYVSPSATKLWGSEAPWPFQSAAEFFAVVHADDRERVAQASRSGNDTSIEYRIVREDGGIRWLRSTRHPVRDATGTVVRLAGLTQDITEQRQIEDQLRASQKMESLGRLAGGVAHDFNNILTVIDACVELLDDPDATDTALVVADLRRASARASALTQQLLAFGRRDMVAPRAIELDAHVAETAKMLRRLIGEDVHLDLRLGAPGVSVWIDPGSLAQILVNLAVNARDAMPSGGTLTIATVTSEGEGGELRVGLSVADTGTGMSAEVQARAFEPFFTTKPTGRGTGLGLSVVHGIVERCAGSLSVTSALGAGTRIDVRFTALARSSDGSRASAGATTDDGRGRTILFVEDDEAVRRIGSAALRGRGYHVLSAVDGAEALAVCETSAIVDLVITDVVMPGMDGREFVERATRTRPSLRVIYTSGYTEDHVLLRGIARAEVAFLAKPYGITTMLAKVREVLGPHERTDQNTTASQGKVP